MSTDDYFFDGDGACIITLKDNVVIELVGGCTFPEKGTYFCCSDMVTVTGVALGKDADPEITWDGSTSEVKKLDEKFIPTVSSLVIKSSTADSTKKFKITVDDTGTISATEVTE